MSNISLRKHRKLQRCGVDEDGNVLKPRINGEHPHGDIPGYTFVRTERMKMVISNISSRKHLRQKLLRFGLMKMVMS